MPFIIPERRLLIAHNLLDEPQPGDLCYVRYKEMMDMWRKNRRWTTAHDIFKRMTVILASPEACPLTADQAAAYQLAWQVFFNLHVLEYEKLKRQENGDIL